MPRPTITSENSNRGNSFYVEGMSSSASGWDPVTAFGESNCYGGKSIRGECARIIFYCMVADNRLKLADSATVSSDSGCTMGKLSDMLKWNLENPVNTRELNRNEGGEYLQGNRNPFVDHPEYACKIWGNTNATTRAICAGNLPNPRTLSKITITADDSSDYYVSEDHFIKLKATATYSDSSTEDVTNTVTWASYDTTYAQVDQTGKVTGISGSATGQYVNIRASIGSVIGTHGVYVWSNGDYGTKIGTGTTGGSGQTDSGNWSLVTSNSQLVAGNEYVIACNSKGFTAGALSNSILTNEATTFSSDKKTITSLASDTTIFTLGGTSGAYTFSNNGEKLGATAVKKLAYGSGTQTWNVTVSLAGDATIQNTTASYGSMQYNASSPRFTTYTSSQTAVQLYTRSGSPDVTDSVSLDKTSAIIDVGSTYTLNATSSGMVTWTTSSSTVATVTPSGTNNTKATIKGLVAGTATIEAKCGTASAICQITVKRADQPATWPYENGKPYTMSLDNNGKYYFVGDTREGYSYYGETSKNIDDAAPVYFENNSHDSNHNLYCYRNSQKTYIQVVKSGNYTNFNMTTTEPSVGWKYDASIKSIVFPLDGTDCSIGTYSNYTTFSATTVDKTVYAAEFEAMMDANEYATEFLNRIKCTGTGSTSFVGSDWTYVANLYSTLNASMKNVLKSAVSNQSGTIVEQCVARYDAIVAKYSAYQDFMSRGVSKSSRALGIIRNEISMPSIAIVVIVISTSGIAIAGLIKKRKEEKR